MPEDDTLPVKRESIWSLSVKRHRDCGDDLKRRFPLCVQQVRLLRTALAERHHPAYPQALPHSPGLPGNRDPDNTNSQRESRGESLGNGRLRPEVFAIAKRYRKTLDWTGNRKKVSVHE